MSRPLRSFALFAAVLALLATSCSSQATLQQGSFNRDEPAAAEGAIVSGGTGAAEPREGDNSNGGDEQTTTSTDLDMSDFQIVEPAQVAALLVDCEAGSDMACDVLFAASDFGSDEERTALNCGGRSPGDGAFCTDGLEPEGDELWFDASSAALPTIVAACERDDMTACDLLHFRSAVASSFEEVGRTCGGRVMLVFPDCRTAFDK